MHARSCFFSVGKISAMAVVDLSFGNVKGRKVKPLFWQDLAEILSRSQIPKFDLCIRQFQVSNRLQAYNV